MRNQYYPDFGREREGKNKTSQSERSKNFEKI